MSDRLNDELVRALSERLHETEREYRGVLDQLALLFELKAEHAAKRHHPRDAMVFREAAKTLRDANRILAGGRNG